jgi:hypothetical protein
LHRRTPDDAYRAIPKATPTTNGHAQGRYRLRYDRLDAKGKMSIRRAGRMQHLGVGTPHPLHASSRSPTSTTSQ